MSTRLLPHIVLSAFVLSLATTTGWHCRKDVEEFQPYPGSVEEVDDILKKAQEAGAKTDFQKGGAIPDTVLATKSGIRIGLANTEQLFADETGKLVPCSTCKSFRLDMTEVVRRGDAIGRGINTMTTNGQMLESSGILFLEAVCDGKKLKLRNEQSLRIQIPVKDPQNTGSLIKYQGVIKSGVFAGWEKTSEQVATVKWSSGTAGNQTEAVGFEVKTRQLDWIMLSRPIEGQQKPLNVLMPLGFNDRNTQVYVVLKNKQAIAKLEYDANRKYFVFNQMPAGQAATIVTIGKAGSRSLLGQLAVDVKTDLSLPLKIIPREVNEQQILDFLNSL